MNVRTPSKAIIRHPAFVTLIATSALLASTWYVADALVRPRPVRRRLTPTRLLAVTQEGDTTTLRMTRNIMTMRRGAVTVNWDDEHGGLLLGDVQASGPGWAERPVIKGVPVVMPGDWLRLSAFGRGDPSSRGLKFSTVTLRGEHGALPAWWVPARNTPEIHTHGAGDQHTGDWVIIMHGYQGLRQDALRFLGAYHRLGLNSLVVTYRNAHGAGRTPQGVYRLSADEWRDLEVAVEYSLQHGAKRIVLMGLSMGGSITLAFMRKSPLARHISGVILDSPALEWRELIAHHVRKFYLPAGLAKVVEWLTTFKAGQDFDEVDHLRHAQIYNLPMLIFHGTDDQTVPVAQLDRLYEARPDLIEYVRVAGGEHLRVWNIDPKAYEQHLARYLSEVLA